MLDQSKSTNIVGSGFTKDATHSQAAGGNFYTDPQFHQLELDRLFAREWNYFCHQSQIPNPGDFLTGVVSDEHIYVLRGKDGEIRTFYNVCQHRGHQLLKEPSGNIKSVVVCPYHAWSYDHEGNLRGAPKMKEVDGFDRSKVKLTQVRTEVIGGFVFINFDPDAKPFREMAPEFEPIITSMVTEVDKLQCVKIKPFEINANWKIVTENFLEAYHVEFSGDAHVALGNIIDIDTYRFNISGRTIEYTAGGGKEEVIPYQVNKEDDFINTRGAPFHQVFLFPHMSFSVFPGTNMMFVFNMRPNGPDHTSEEIIYFTLDGSMSPPTETAEEYVSDNLNPEDIELVEAVHRGVSSKGFVPGRLMVDPDKKAAWGEQFIHHFDTLVLDAIERGES
ncbi:aromatic ring-hydroxylating dioxygenase subunit alpha [Pelagimonas sp. KU-00592-HH]|uniref:aromatic ring-hydroxylating oxygenase subunit alpha n=1 Tax=Pelagimonas sp. KU-00592-HH TaxID=3127651 RepID=UPI0031026C03